MGILLVEDDKKWVKHLSQKIEASGYRVYNEKTPMKAFQLLEQFPISGIILDLNLHLRRNQEDGFFFLDLLKTHDFLIPTIILSQFSSQKGIGGRCFRYNFVVDVLSKSLYLDYQEKIRMFLDSYQEKKIKFSLDNVLKHRELKNQLNRIQHKILQRCESLKVASNETKIEKLNYEISALKEICDELNLELLSYQEKLARKSDQNVQELLFSVKSKLNTLLVQQEQIDQNFNKILAKINTYYKKDEIEYIDSLFKLLESKQLRDIIRFLSLIDKGHISYERGNAILKVIVFLLKTNNGLLLDVLAQKKEQLKKMNDVLDSPNLDIKHKIKISIPIIPIFLSYIGEVEIKSGLKLSVLWQKLSK